jgi:hypothetical protein
MVLEAPSFATLVQGVPPNKQKKKSSLVATLSGKRLKFCLLLHVSARNETQNPFSGMGKWELPKIWQHKAEVKGVWITNGTKNACHPCKMGDVRGNHEGKWEIPKSTTRKKLW